MKAKDVNAVSMVNELDHSVDESHCIEDTPCAAYTIKPFRMGIFPNFKHHQHCRGLWCFFCVMFHSTDVIRTTMREVPMTNGYWLCITLIADRTTPWTYWLTMSQRASHPNQYLIWQINVIFKFREIPTDVRSVTARCDVARWSESAIMEFPSIHLANKRKHHRIL